jgi:LysM repeat protein
MNDELERTLRDSLDRHAAGAGHPTGGLSDVFARVDRRRSRRRSIAVVGSLAAVAAGVVGFAALAGSDADQAMGTPDGVSVEPTTTLAPFGQTWSCSGYIGADGAGRDLYADCYPVAYVDGGVQCVATTFVVPTMVEVDPASGIAATTPDGCTLATGYGPACAGWPPETAPPTTGEALDTVPDMTGPFTVDSCVDASVPATSVPLYDPATDYSIDTTPPMNMEASVPATAVDCRQATTITSIAETATTAPAETSTGEQVHIVQPGDSLHSIAERYSVAMEIIMNYNAWPECANHLLLPGDRVLIPPGGALPPT